MHAAVKAQRLKTLFAKTVVMDELSCLQSSTRESHLGNTPPLDRLFVWFPVYLPHVNATQQPPGYHVQHRLKSMMAITQQWLTLLLAHIDWVGQSERIHAALGTLNQLTGPSSSVMMHLVVTRAAVQHVKQKAEGLRDRKLYEASKRAIVLMLESTSALSSRDEDADISALQEVSLLLQTKLTSGFGRIQQHLHDMNHAYDRLAADILWEDAVPEIVYAIREAAGISKEGNNGEAVHTREVQDTQAGPPENLDSFISRICAARLLDCGASPQKSSFYPASTDDRTTTLSDGFFWSLALTMLAAAFLPFMRSLQSFVCSFLVFASVFYSSQFSSPPSCDALTAFFCENTLHLWLRRQLSEQSTGTDASKSQWYCKDTSLSM